MDPLSATACIITILQLSSKVVGYLNNVKDASKEHAKCAVEFSNLQTLLLKLRFHLEEGSADIQWYTAISDLAIENGPLDQFKQALETLPNSMTDGGRLKKTGEALVWKFKKEEIASILDRIERLKTLVEIALQMDHFKLSQAIKDDTSFVRTHQSDIINRRQQGTGQWFLDAPEVATWLREAKGTLFCPGILGAGKTMVAAIAVDQLLKSVQNSSVGVAYVYCNYKAQEEQDASSLLAAILKQLVQAQPSTSEPVQRLHKKYSTQGTKPSLDEVFGALRDVLTHYSAVHIVIDALDECRDNDRDQFLAKLRDLRAGRDLRLMVTSRFITEIEEGFREALRLEVRARNEDVKQFDMVQQKVAEAADGMFLLARLLTDSLSDKITVHDVKLTLAKFPKGSEAIDHAYKDALQRIEGQLLGHCELAKKVLSWITFSKRPLTTAEICCALALEPDKAKVNLEHIPDVEDLVSVCAGLVVVDQESATIRLVHYTAQEYFERIRHSWNPSAQAFKSGSCSTDEEFEERIRQNVFLDYAAKHRGEHAREVEAEVCELACSFLLDCNSLSCAAQVLFAPGYRYRGYSQNHPTITALHYAALFGLSVIAGASAWFKGRGRSYS
ncbi:hypothetical protein BDY21DRAFT_359136 [Lineolata rhizophorae]|uniref:Uncharacterized protein n=1 Tax=Lineolata rhizophorae TaxID=578093 RepID=A0A6A6NMG3_9PEZI|nr:hypothetical protein BDY21DRAFT_359136 [Lineolata rhizophorae]